MSQHDPGPDDDLALQREVARIALAGVDGFALAGSGAIREHGMIDRPTEDVDLFTSSPDEAKFGTAVDVITERLRGSGLTVDQARRAPTYARLHVAAGNGRQVDVDLGVDWRQDEPVRLGVGPVLSLADAVGNKISALYSRSEARDFLDVDAIRRSGRFTDEDLIIAAADRDPGFQVDMFAQQLNAVRRLTLRDVSSYGVTASELEDVKTRCTQWAQTLQQPTSNEPTVESDTDQLRELRSQQQARFPTSPTEALRGGAVPSYERPRRPTPSGRPADPGEGVER